MVNILIDHRAGEDKHGPGLTSTLDSAIERAQDLLGGVPEDTA